MNALVSTPAQNELPVPVRTTPDGEARPANPAKIDSSSSIMERSSALTGGRARLTTVTPVRSSIVIMLDSTVSLALPPQLRPVIKPLADLALKAAIGRVVKSLAAERFREVVLAGEGVRRIVVVFVAAAIAFLLHQLGRRIQNMFRRQQRTALLRRAHGGAKRLVGGVGFRRGGEIDHRLRDRELAFGMTEEIIGVLGGVADHQRLRIGEADIFDRHPHHAAREKQRVLAG